MSDEKYIPNARDAVVAYFGRNAAGNLRCHCVRCCDKHPLTDASKVYGDLHWDACDQCEVCWVSLRQMSMLCQAEHDEQQARWSRGPITHVVEMGMPGAVRCRIY